MVVTRLITSVRVKVSEWERENRPAKAHVIKKSFILTYRHY